MKIEIPFGERDSELKGWEYTIPEGMEAVIEDGKIIVKEKESEDERIRKEIKQFILDTIGEISIDDKENAWIAYLEKRKEPDYCHHEVDLSGCSEEYSKGYYDGWNNCNQQHSQLEAEQKPAEWSEEDERIRGHIIDVLTYYAENHSALTVAFIKRDIDWLKSLCPQSHWKPSEEQMDELEKVSSGNTCAFNYGILRKLYDDLKKL